MPSSPLPEMGFVSRATLASIAEELASCLPDVVEGANRMITEHEAPYGPRGIVLADDLKETLTANIGAILNVLTGDPLSVEGEMSIPHATGRRRAEQGVALEAVLHSYRLGGQILMDRMLQLAQRRSAEELRAFLGVATVVMEVVDQFSQAVVVGYRQTEAELRRRDSQRKQAMFDALLDGRGATDPPATTAAASLLGLPAKGPYAVAVCTFDLTADHNLSAVRDVCAVYGFAAAWRTRGDREIGIIALGTSPLARLLDVLRSAGSGRVGVSGTFDSLRELPDSHRFAEIALLTSPGEGRDVACIDERLLESLIVSCPDLAWRLTAGTLDGVLKLREPERGVLLETLTAWFECDRSAASAARRLYCHRNTIINRLRRIQKLTGKSLEDHRDLLAAYLALLTLRLLPSAESGAATAVASEGGARLSLR